MIMRALSGSKIPQAFRGFAGTSVLIMVGVATDTARRLNAEQAMSKYGEMEEFYEGNKPSEISDDSDRLR
jgi:preprotein translocase subunit SecY